MLVKGQSRKLTVKGGAGIVSWGSSNTAVAGVSAGKVVAKGKGKATITVKKGTQKKSCQVTAVEIDVEDTVSLDQKGCSHDVEWTSSDDDICEVEDGILIPYSSGTVTVKAKVHGMVWKCKVVITDSTEDDWNDDLDDDSENADDGYMDDEVDAVA